MHSMYACLHVARPGYRFNFVRPQYVACWPSNAGGLRTAVVTNMTHSVNWMNTYSTTIASIVFMVINSSIRWQSTQIRVVRVNTLWWSFQDLCALLATHHSKYFSAPLIYFVPSCRRVGDESRRTLERFVFGEMCAQCRPLSEAWQRSWCNICYSIFLINAACNVFQSQYCVRYCPVAERLFDRLTLVVTTTQRNSVDQNVSNPLYASTRPWSMRRQFKDRSTPHLSMCYTISKVWDFTVTFESVTGSKLPFSLQVETRAQSPLQDALPAPTITQYYCRSYPCRWSYTQRNWNIFQEHQENRIRPLHFRLGFDVQRKPP